MRTRVGIELTPVACRIVEVVDRGPGWRSRGGDSIVRSFAVWPAPEVDEGGVLESLRGKAAAVVVWGTPSEHRQVEVTVGSYETMRAEALRTLAVDGVPARGVWADIAPGGAADARRMPVVVSVAASKPMLAALQPLADAGIRVRTVMTPAAALAAIARSRRAYSVPDTTEAYVALDRTAACAALIRNGALVTARDLEWGFIDDRGDQRAWRRREEIAGRLGDDLAELFRSSADAGPVTQVCICGGLPDLRTTTLPLMERFDVEVEILDSLTGIDARGLPQAAAEFRERVSELRMAWVAAADWTTINLLRPERRRASHMVLSRAAVVAGVAAGLGGGWSLAPNDRPAVAAASRSAPRSIARAATAVPPPAAPAPSRDRSPAAVVAGAPEETQVAAPSPAQDPPPIMHEPPAVTSEPERAADLRSPAPAAVPAATPTEPPPIRHEPPYVAPPTRAAAPRSAHAFAKETPAPRDPQPFDAVLSSVLFSPDRQLAIIDGHVVGRGDSVRDATVIEISSGGVLLRDSRGQLRRLSAGGAGR